MAEAILVGVIVVVVGGVLLAIPGLGLRLWGLLHVGPWIRPCGTNIRFTIQDEPWCITEREGLWLLIYRILRENVWSKFKLESLTLQDEVTKYIYLWVDTWLAGEKLPEAAKELLNRYLTDTELGEDAKELLGRHFNFKGIYYKHGQYIGLRSMTCTRVVHFRNFGKGIGLLKQVSHSGGQLTWGRHGFWCRVSRKRLCNQAHHAVIYKLEPETNLPPDGIPIRAGDPGHGVNFLLRLELRPDYQGKDSEQAIRDVLAWADFSDFAKRGRGMRGKVRVKYIAQHGKWLWDQETEQDSSATVSLKAPSPGKPVETDIGRKLARQAQSLRQHHKTVASSSHGEVEYRMRND